MKAPKRNLSDIADDIRSELKRDTAGIIKLSDLLAEAKRQVNHGAWLPWIKENFSMSEATAQRYLQVNRFLKSRSVRDFEVATNLSASALYNVSAKQAKHRPSIYTPKAIEAIFNEAQQKPVGANRAWDIAFLLQQQIEELEEPQTEEELEGELEAEAEAAAEQEAAEQAEAEAILDGPPPELPPPSVDFVMSAFDQAISKLKELSTKHSDKFRASSHPASDIEEVAEFLFHVAHTKAKAAA